jgi:dihydroneopterin aldolase/2-amino-4-hydroxy-6-hydroxymethyldihydropteridine diphosphokinase
VTTNDESRQDALDTSGRRLDQIRLSGITALGYHGVFEHERREGQTFVADVVVHLDTRRAAARDDLAHTLNYGVLAEQVAAVLAGEPVDLIETVAERIAATVLASGIVQAVDVAVHKPNAPIQVPFGDVVVAIHRDRSKLPAAEPYLPRPVTEATQASRPVPTATATFPVTPAPGAPVVAPAPAAPVAVGAWSEPVVAPAPGGLSVDGPDRTATGLELEPVLQPVPAASSVVDGEIVTDALDRAPEGPVDVVLALGANLGPAQETLRAAVSDLARTAGVEVVEVSPLARTAAVGGPDQSDYLNAVVLATTTLAPRELLRATQGIELAHGRERHEHWGPRTLDIDIVLYGSVLAVTDDLELPHPRAHQRAFVLQPWAEVDPHAVLPGLGGGPVGALAATAPDRDGVRWLALDWLTAPISTVGNDTGVVPTGGPGAEAQDA